MNREDALDAVLRSLARQTDRDFEVIVADDGSGAGDRGADRAMESRNSAVRLDACLAGASRLPRRRNPQPRDPGRAAAAIASSSTATASRGRISSPAIARSPSSGWFVTGNRILMSEELTRHVLREQLEPENWNFATGSARAQPQATSTASRRCCALPLGPLRKLRPGEWQHARSCNLAVWRADLDRVDGFDADYNGWGREDSDLLVRLLHAGVRRKDGNFATGVLHLWHPAADRSALPDNDEKLDRVRGEKRVRACAACRRCAAMAQNAAARMGAARS